MPSTSRSPTGRTERPRGVPSAFETPRGPGFMADSGQTALVRNGDVVLHRGHPRSAPGRPRGFVVLGPRTDAPGQGHPPAVGAHRDALRVDLRVALQRSLDRVFDGTGLDGRID